MQSAQQSIAVQQSQAQQQAQALAPAPPPDVLYNNALRDYNGGKNDLAVQEFSDYIKFYPNTDLAGNSYFYLAEIQFKQGNYKEAVKNYDLVLQNYASGNKAAAAQLKKGFALLELGQQEDGAQELRHVVARYPRSNEATQTRDRLRKLGSTDCYQTHPIVFAAVSLRGGRFRVVSAAPLPLPRLLPAFWLLWHVPDAICPHIIRPDTHSHLTGQSLWPARKPATCHPACGFTGRGST